MFYGSSDSERGRIIDCVVSVVMLIFAALVGTLYATPFERPFFEGDDSISFPVVAHETVPFHMLLVYAILIPALCVIAIPLIVRWHIGFSETIRPVTDVVLAVVGLATTGGLTAFCTTFIKQYVGRPRPNFFALCGYPYNSVTHTYGTPHLLGSYSSCTKSVRGITAKLTSSTRTHHFPRAIRRGALLASAMCLCCCGSPCEAGLQDVHVGQRCCWLRSPCSALR